jgi:hypothetical protein
MLGSGVFLGDRSGAGPRFSRYRMVPSHP